MTYGLEVLNSAGQTTFSTENQVIHIFAEFVLTEHMVYTQGVSSGQVALPEGTPSGNLSHIFREQIYSAIATWPIVTWRVGNTLHWQYAPKTWGDDVLVIKFAGTIYFGVW